MKTKNKKFKKLWKMILLKNRITNSNRPEDFKIEILKEIDIEIEKIEKEG